ncbi:nicotinamide-nucleotide amidohydrolase family protein [Pedobacter sp. HMF7647]|uniref:Nicotinamide-nucleotide amidohydrolase family protein n=1 Tax=Hufsiella arboris TaxID=2695275 RepID=A0A7K1YEZ9_9SPHI|nr:CinA family protein [Hufsiella arboris]MXV53175.1 nicotinamide-nucleotide amidohydrolase family protein [Hufsiella arboris]
MPSSILTECSHLVMEKNLTVALAESATAGRVAAEISLIPDCGKILKGGIVCYDACIKQDILGVPEELVKKYTPESAEVTEEMAKRLKDVIPADIHIAVTGLTMPGGSETDEKPVGTMFVHLLLKDRSIAIRQIFKGEPESVVLKTIDMIARNLIRELQQPETVITEEIGQVG